MYFTGDKSQKRKKKSTQSFPWNEWKRQKTWTIKEATAKKKTPFVLDVDTRYSYVFFFTFTQLDFLISSVDSIKNHGSGIHSRIYICDCGGNHQLRLFRC